jgi:predicted phage terminase large subunit-like protein
MVKTLKKSSLALSSTELLQIRARAALELKSRETHDFRSFVATVNPKFTWYRHCDVIANVLERVAREELKNVMFFLPPRHSKSEEVTRLFSAYYLYKFPSRWVGLTSYAGELAWNLSMDARENYRRTEQPIHDDASAKKEWRTAHGGGYWASGVRGPITGKGFDLGLTDDPIKNEEEAYSETIREGVNQWYDAVWFTRREPNAAEILVQTRWHQHDLAGYLLEKESMEPRHWHIVCLQAIKEEIMPEFPSTCTIEPDWREPGQALCPERYDERGLMTIRKTIGTQFWISLYQQSPKLPEGNIWKREWFKTFDPYELAKLEKTDPKYVDIVDIGFDWDAAYTKDDENSACAMLKAGVDKKKNDVYIFDMAFRWVEFPALIRWMADEKGPHFVEAKASGKSAVQTLKHNSIAAREVQIQGADKISRTRLVTPIAETGHLYVAKHVLERLLHDPKQGLLHFPNGSHDDVNDAFVQALNRLFKRKQYKFGIIGERKPDEHE